MSFSFNENNASYGGNSRPHLPSGWYIVRILKCREVTNPRNGKGPRFEFEFDIAQGNYKNFFSDEYDRFCFNSDKAFWTGTFIQNYTGKSEPFMNALIIRFMKTNPSFKYRDDGGKCFEGFRIGVSIQAREQEYNGRTSWRYHVMNTYSGEELTNKKDYNNVPLKLYEDEEIQNVQKNDTKIEDFDNFSSKNNAENMDFGIIEDDIEF